MKKTESGQSSREIIIIRILVILLALFLTVSFANADQFPSSAKVPLSQEVTDYGLTPFYAQTAWPSAHRDSSNSDYVPFVSPAANKVKWNALDGAAVLPAPAMGPEGNLYITSGRGPGNSHLHAFDRDGNLLWQSDPQEDLNDLDSMAVISCPTLDRLGDVYVGDSNQFWAFKPDGTLKWVVELPEASSPFLSAVITKEGFVGGITTNGKVALFKRNDGSLAVPVLDLPGGSGPAAPSIPPGLWGGGLMDPEIIEPIFNAIAACDTKVANTPAVHPESGRIYITAAGGSPDEGVLYGIDLINDHLEITFQSSMAGNSGTSPAISPDGKHIYVVDGNGVMIAFNAQTGGRIWSSEGAGAKTSPAVGPNGTVYTGAGSVLTALKPEDGSQKWSVNYDWLAAYFLPSIPPEVPLPPSFPSRNPVARTNSVVTVSATQVWVVLVLGYEFINPTDGGIILQPRVSLLATVDPADGSLIDFTLLRDTCEGVISLSSDGSLYVSHAGALSSLFFYGLNPSLPPILRIPGPPEAGFTALEPKSFLDHTLLGIGWVQKLNHEALFALFTENVERALTATGRGRTQLEATAGTISDAYERGEIDEQALAMAGKHVLVARWHLTAARIALGSENLLPKDLIMAAVHISQAETALKKAISALM